MPSARSAPSPIVRVLSRDVGRFHRWCTPSILPEQERVEDIYGSDISISAGFFGTIVDHDGTFGEAARFAAVAQGADRTMFSVHGSSGSNWIVLCALALERQDAVVLVARSIQHSVINALRAYGLTSASCRRPTSRATRRCCRRASSRCAKGCARRPRRSRSSTPRRPTRA